MKKLAVIVVLVVIAGVAWHFQGDRVREYIKKRNAPVFTTEKVEQGSITWNVQATGKIEPILKVQIGSFVSGPIVELHAGFNDYVEEGKLLAKVDPRLYKAAVVRDQAAYDRARAEVLRVKATLQKAENNMRRAEELYDINAEYISESELDQLRFDLEAIEAEREISILAVKQAYASLENSKLNLEYTDILAPSSGIIIDRKIEPGQTLVAQFQTPELFILAPDMDKRMWIMADVVEADVGHILRAQRENRRVEFSVDAYEGELFTGKIIQVRQNPTSEQNVVTYPVVVETANPDLRLLPGMTANLTFEIEQRHEVLKIPGAAIRYVPTDSEYVREEDKEILEGVKSNSDDDKLNVEPSAAERVEANRKRRQRHVWIQEDDKLRAIAVEFGLSDGRFYELVDGELAADQQLVTGIEDKRR